MEAPLTAFDQALKEVYEALPNILAKEMEEETEMQSPLAHFDRKATAKHFASELLHLRQRCRNGLENILERLKNNPASSEKGHILEQYLFKTFTSVLTPATFTRVVLRIVSGETWAEALKIPTESIELMYQGGKAIFEDGLYEQAAQCFTFLSWFDSRQYEFWMALGHCQFHSDNYSAAVRSYGVAAHCCPTESLSFLYSASCFEAMGDIEQASIYLKEGLTIERSKTTVDYSLINSIEQKLEEYQRGPVSPIS